MKNVILILMLFTLCSCSLFKQDIFDGSYMNPDSYIILKERDEFVKTMLPYCLPCPGKKKEPMGIYPKEDVKYLKQKIIFNKKFMSARELIKKLAKQAKVEIIIDGGIPQKKNRRWDHPRIIILDIPDGTYTFEFLLQELISYMQEVGIPKKGIQKWEEANKGKTDDLIFADHRTIAELKEKSVIIKTIVIGSYGYGDESYTPTEEEYKKLFPNEENSK